MNNYEILEERPDYPESICLLRALQVLMTPQEAQIAVLLPAPDDQIACKLSIRVEDVQQKIDGEHRRGIILPTSTGYFFARSVLRPPEDVPLGKVHVQTSACLCRFDFEFFPNSCYCIIVPVTNS